MDLEDAEQNRTVMLQEAHAAAQPSICEALRQPRMVCDWQVDEQENNPAFHKFSKLPASLKSISIVYYASLEWDVYAEARLKLPGALLCSSR